jgi:hypothetical protein
MPDAAFPDDGACDQQDRGQRKKNEMTLAL